MPSGCLRHTDGIAACSAWQGFVAVLLSKHELQSLEDERLPECMRTDITLAAADAYTHPKLLLCRTTCVDV
jgi:hypothetical protein